MPVDTGQQLIYNGQGTTSGGNMIILSDNKNPEQIIIDDDDLERVSAHKWRKYPSCRYVQASVNGRTTSISRFILKAPEGVSVDHINGNKLDNRKENLRVCSHAANMKNRKPNKSGKSAYKGVVLLPNGKFRSKIDNNGDRFELGVYPTERDAVVAYNAAAKVLHGEYAYMNELPEAWNTRATDTETALLREQVRVLREALIDGLKQLESWEVLIDGECGSCRTLEQLEEVGWLSNATIKCRQAIAATAPKGE